ncbi:MAG: DUF5615 family PIN-like protein [Chloroflexota bacterium]
MKFLADENFDNRIVRGLLRRQPDLDIVRVQDLEIAGADDPTILAWAAQAGRILLTHDERTIPKHVYERLATGQTIAGVIIASDSLPISTVIENILLIVGCSSATEWSNQLQRLPL